jgi:uncharacterized membrane protein
MASQIGWREERNGLVDSRLPKLLFVLMVVFAAVYFSSLYGKLPEVVASHFDAAGRANGWQPKELFLGFFIGGTVLAVVVGFAVPQLIKVVPVELLNLPNKRYWLSPERAEGSVEFLTGSFGWLGCGMYVLMLFVFNYAVQANLHPHGPPDPNTMWAAVIGFGVFALIWVIYTTFHFARTPD